MDRKELGEFESNVVFLAELAEKSDNPLFHHGVYRGKIEDDMLAYNSSVFLSIDQSECRDIIKRLRERGVLSIRPGNEGAISYTNYYYHATSFTVEGVLEEIGSRVLEKTIGVINEFPELIEPLGCALVFRYKGFRYVNVENVDARPEQLHIMIKNCLLLKNRFVYTGSASGINFFIPDTPFFKLLGHLNKKFVNFFFNRLAATELGVVDNYEEMRQRILSDSRSKKIGLDSYDVKAIDYIFDLAKSLEIPIPMRYTELYDQYKESIISIKVLERMSPLLRGSVETLADSITHYKKGTISDYRLALINIDNTIELILRNHMLKKDVNLEDVKKFNFERLLKKSRDIEVVANNLEKFKQIHGARNQMYHMPILGGVDKLFIKDAINLAKQLFESETNEKLKVKM